MTITTKLRMYVGLAFLLFALSCRHDYFPENETYNNSSAFQLTSKRISLDEASHKAKLLPELEKAKAEIRAFSRTDEQGRVINYGNGIFIDTDEVIYIENGPNYHTYTFNIKRDNALPTDPVENLVLSPMSDGTYREILVSYNFTEAEKQKLALGIGINTNGKTEITELAKGTFNSGNALARFTCGNVSETIWESCSEHVHNQSNVEDWINCKAETKPRVYTVLRYKCWEENDDVITPTDPGGGGGGGGVCTTCPPKEPTPNEPCNGNGVLIGPQEPGLSPGNGGCGGIVTEPNVPEITIDPCKRTKVAVNKANEILSNSDVQSQMDAVLKGKINAPKEWSVAIGQASNGYEVTPAVEQNTNQGTVPVSQLTNPYIADGHSHAGDPGAPSGGDLYKMIKALADSPGLKYRYVYGKNSSGLPEVYALIIDNPILAQNFIAQFPENENYDPASRAIRIGSKLGEEFYTAREHYYEGRNENTSGEDYDSRAIGFAYILEKFNAGISIAKADPQGDLKKINASIQKIIVPNSGGIVKEGVKVSKCP